jgi:hypothetical protein
VLIVLAEFAESALGTPLFAEQGLPLPLRATDASPKALQRLRPDRAGIQRFFTLNRRPFCLYVVVRGDEDRAALIDRANSVLGSLLVAGS